MRFLDIFLNVAKSKVVNNFINLGSIQIAEMILPLLTVPYVIRIVGFEKVGLIAFATAIVSYFNIFINFGFNLTATKQISQSLSDETELNRIFFNVTWTKIFLILISILIFLILLLFPRFGNESLIYILLFGNIIFQNLIPTWFLQGLQDLNFSTKISLFFKILTTLSIFFCIKDYNDYWYLAFLPFIASFLSLLIILSFVVRKYKLDYLHLSMNAILNELKDGKFVFLSQLKISLFNSFNILILGFLLNDKAVGIFSSADKIIKILSSLQIPIVSALFPYFSKLFNDDFGKGSDNLRKIALYGSFSYLGIIFATFLLSPIIVKILFGSHVEEIVLLIRIMLLIPLFVFLNNLYGTQFLLNVNQDKVFLKNIIIAASINILFIVPLTKFFNMYGTAISILITEFMVFFLMYNSARKFLYHKNEN